MHFAAASDSVQTVVHTENGVVYTLLSVDYQDFTVEKCRVQTKHVWQCVDSVQMLQGRSEYS